MLIQSMGESTTPTPRWLPTTLPPLLIHVWTFSLMLPYLVNLLVQQQWHNFGSLAATESLIILCPHQNLLKCFFSPFKIHPSRKEGYYNPIFNDEEISCINTWQNLATSTPFIILSFTHICSLHFSSFHSFCLLSFQSAASVCAPDSEWAGKWCHIVPIQAQLCLPNYPLEW